MQQRKERVRQRTNEKERRAVRRSYEQQEHYIVCTRVTTLIDCHKKCNTRRLYNDHLQALVGARSMGLSLVTLLATALDPRTNMLAGIHVSDHSLVWAEVRRRAIVFKREARGDPPAAEGGDVPPINFERAPAWAIMNVGAVPVQPMALAAPEGALLEHIIDREISDYRFGGQQLLIIKAWDPISRKVLEYENPLE
jgi:hypothetical protein